VNFRPIYLKVKLDGCCPNSTLGPVAWACPTTDNPPDLEASDIINETPLDVDDSRRRFSVVPGDAFETLGAQPTDRTRKVHLNTNSA
jgi:hypothetical protein